MRVKFYGTSHGVPEKGRAGQSIFIEVGESGYFFDMGAPAMERMRTDGYDVNKVKAVFFTHLDSDHFLGFMSFFCLSVWYFKEMKYKVFYPEERGMNFTKSYVDNMMIGSKYPEDRIFNEVFSEGEIYKDENITVTAVKTLHLGGPCKSYGFLIEAEGKKIYITGDLQYTTADTLADFPDVAKGKLDLLVSEGAHFSSKALMNDLEKCEAEKIAIVHVFPQSKYEEFENEKSRLKGEFLFPIDGDEYII